VQDPIESDDNLEERVKKLEEDRDVLLANETLLLRLARYHRIALQELKANFDVEAGDARQRFDHIEQTLEAHGKRFDHIDEKLDQHTEVLGKILGLLEGRGN